MYTGSNDSAIYAQPHTQWTVFHYRINTNISIFFVHFTAFWGLVNIPCDLYTSCYSHWTIIASDLIISHHQPIHIFPEEYFLFCRYWKERSKGVKDTNIVLLSFRSNSNNIPKVGSYQIACCVLIRDGSRTFTFVIEYVDIIGYTLICYQRAKDTETRQYESIYLLK